MKARHPLHRQLQGGKILVAAAGKGLVNLAFGNLQSRDRCGFQPVEALRVLQHGSITALPDIGNDVEHHLLHLAAGLLAARQDGGKLDVEIGVMYIEEFHRISPLIIDNALSQRHALKI